MSAEPFVEGTGARVDTCLSLDRRAELEAERAAIVEVRATVAGEVRHLEGLVQRERQASADERRRIRDVDERRAALAEEIDEARRHNAVIEAEVARLRLELKQKQRELDRLRARLGAERRNLSRVKASSTTWAETLQRMGYKAFRGDAVELSPTFFDERAPTVGGGAEET